MEDNVSEPIVVPTTAKKEAPIIQARLRHKILKMPEEAWKASGIRIFGRKIRALIYTTDLAVIKNCDADAVFAVYSAAVHLRGHHRCFEHTGVLWHRRWYHAWCAHGYARS